MNMLKQTFFIAAAVLYFVAQIEAIKPNRCSNGALDEIEALSIQDCVQEPCELKAGRTIKIEEIFTPSRDVYGLTHMALINSKMPLPNIHGTNAARHVFTIDGKPATWPLQRGYPYWYKYVLFIPPHYPSIPAVVSWGLKDTSGQMITCFTVNGKITNDMH